MKYRNFGRTHMKVSEIGYGMWGLAEWEDTDPTEVEKALDLSVELGCNFYDTAWGYGEGKSERILQALLKRHPMKHLHFATKIPPKNRIWPSKNNFKIEDVFPKEYIIEYTDYSLKNLGVETIPLQQFHVWEDAWAELDEWKEAIYQLKKAGKIEHVGISINRWEPANAIKTLKTGLIDAVQVIYNIFDQNPEDELFPVCKDLDIGVIARVPFDEGTLTGNLTKDTKFPEGDWRASYFVPENLISSVEHADALRPLVPDNMSMAEMALRFILCSDDVHTIIPGMRKLRNVKSSMSTSDGQKLPEALHKELKKHRWDRVPTSWSQ